MAMRRWLDIALDAGADTIFWDEPHLYIPEWDDLRFAPDHAWACRCPRCLDRFRAEFGEPMPGAEAPDELTPAVHAFRQTLLLDFLGEMTAYVQAKGAQNAICLLPIGGGGREGLPWDRAVTLSGVDVFGTDPYWRIFQRDPAEFVTEQTRQVVAACEPHGIAPHIWVQAFGIPAGAESEVEVALRTAAAEGATVLAAWAYRASAPFEGASERPDVVWEVIGKAYRSLRGEP